MALGESEIIRFGIFGAACDGLIARNEVAIIAMANLVKNFLL